MPTPKEEDFQGTDRFGIQRRLGAGAFGVVYQVYDRERGTVVALKTLRQSNVEALYRLKREFRALADIAHPNLVNLHELLTHEEQWFFTMELVEGVNFLRYARQGAEPAEASLSDEPTSPMDGPAPIRPTPASASSAQTDRLRAALRQAVHGIQALHAAGKLHRDLKPSNILVTRKGRLVLLDFGLVTELGGPGSGGSRSLVGTPAYMPPEQGSGLPVTEASDWYSLGIMLYETLTGQWPFSGSFVATMWAKQHAEAPAPRDLAPEVPEDLNALCRDLLRRDPKDRPTGEQILARLGGVQGATFEQAATVPATRSAPFVGREAHFSVLRSAFLATKEGRAVIVHVRGTSGTGKTALVRRFLEELRNRNAVVLAGRCYERETVPYKALDSLVDALSQHLKRLPADEVNAILPRDVLALARLFPVLRRVEAVATAKRRVLEIPDSQELRRRAFGALRELLARLAEQRDVVLCIDDLQWGDVDSAALLADLLRPPNPPSLLFIACCRSEDVAGSPFMRKLRSVQPVIEAPESRELVVGELTLQEARDLAESLLGQDSAAREADADTIARESGGNPFFIDELVRYSQAGVEFSEHDPLRDRSARGASARGTTLEEVIRARVLRLPEPARRLLDVLAIAGQPLPSDVARRAAHLGDEEESLSLLRARHLVRTRTGQEGDEIEPYHNRIRETVAAHVPPETRRELHRRLAVALEGSGRADPETLALHFQEAGNLERAAEYAVTAAGRASDALAFYRAARLYRVALELRPREGPQRRELYVKLGNALSNAGHGAEAAHAYLEAVEGARAADAMELQRNAAEQFLISGHIEEGLSVVAAVLANIGMKLPRTRLGALLSVLFRRVLIRARGIGFRERDATQVSAERLTRIDTCWSVAKGLSLADPLRSNEFQTRHLLMALTTGEPYRIARALAIEAGHSAQAGGRSRNRTRKLLEAASALANRIGNPHAIGFTMSVSGIAAYLEGRWSTARDLTEEARTLLRERCQGVAWELDNTRYYSMVSLFYLGRLKELSDQLPETLKEAEDRGDLFHATNIRTRLSYFLRLASDQPQQAREELERAIESWSHGGYFVQHWYEMLGQVECALYAGNAVKAWSYLDSHWRNLKDSLLLRIQIILINSFYLRSRCAIAAAGEGEARTDPQRLLKTAEKSARRIESERVPWGDALALLLRAGIASSRGETQAAISLFGSAADDLKAVDMSLHAAAARRRRGELLGADEGRKLVETADEWMAGQGIGNPGRLSAMLAPGNSRRPEAGV